MTGKNISDQLSYLPDDMIEEAMEMPKRQRTLRFTVRVLRAAACLAVIIGLLFGIWGRGSDPTIPQGGLLTISVGAVSNDSSVLPNVALEKDLELPGTFRWSPAYSYLPGIPLTLSVFGDEYDLEKVYFDVTVDGGSFLKKLDTAQYKQIPLHTTLKNNATVYWHSWYNKSFSNVIDFEGDCAFADIIIYEEKTIIGYAVIGFRRHCVDNLPTISFSAILVESVMFSQEEIKQAPTTEEQIRKQIEEIKATK